ncbi:MAG: RNA polymerase sigma factor [Gemmatimonadota bacterium]
MLDDGPIVERARRGDEAAWRILYERHVDLVFALAMRVVAERDAALDVVQETFIRASRALAGFRGEASFRSWLARIAMNETHTWLRRRAQRSEISLDAASPPVDEERPIDAKLARRETAARAFAFVRRLPEQQRDAVLLRITEGYSYREIGELLGTSEGSARVSYHHGISKLRAYMSEAAASGKEPEADEREDASGGDAGGPGGTRQLGAS